ncbi:MAG: ATP-binding protein [Victivallales bacterium]|jgi:DNA transposition AAA+ family ATPase|nr:ATP-binding protein [Victivallales bacterium]
MSGKKSKRNINLSLGQFQEAVAIYRRDGRADAGQVELLEWLWSYAHKELDGDRVLLEERLGMTWAPIYKTLKGTYEARLENFCERISILRSRVEAGHVSSFIHTPVTRKIWDGLDYARDNATAVLISGPTGCSKTETAKEWARCNNHGRTVYVRVPSRCTRAKLVAGVAHAIDQSSRRKDTAAVETLIAKAMGPRKMLILDEAGHIVPTGRRSGETPLEFVRDLQDTTGCAIALIVTNCYWQAMLHGPQCEILEQFVGRMSYRVIVRSDQVFVGEVESMIRCYGGVEPDAKLVKLGGEIAKASEGRLRTLCEDLRKAASAAKGMGQPMTWQHLALAKKWREAGGSWDDEEVVG